jgi:hypothetical protein
LTASKHRFARWRRLSASDVLLLAEACLVLALSSAAVGIAPLAQVRRLASWPLGRPHYRPDLTAKIPWAIIACVRRLPWRAMCFPQGLTAQIMLRRRGLDSTLYFGASPNTDEGLAAHVWVKLGDADVIGCEEAAGYAVLAKFPARGKVSPGGPKRFDAN